MLGGGLALTSCEVHATETPIRISDAVCGAGQTIYCLKKPGDDKSSPLSSRVFAQRDLLD